MVSKARELETVNFISASLLKPTQHHGIADAAMRNQAPFEDRALIFGQLLMAGDLNVFDLNQQQYSS